MKDKNLEAVNIMREYIELERKTVNEYAKDEVTLPLARELDRVLDNMERRCRIIESK